MNEETIVGRITPNREFALRGFKRIQEMTLTKGLPWRVVSKKEGDGFNIREIYLGNNIELTIIDTGSMVKVLNETNTEMTCNKILKEDIIKYSPAQIAETLFRKNHSSIDYKETARRIVEEFPTLARCKKLFENSLRTRSAKGLVGWRSVIFFHTFQLLKIENDYQEDWVNLLNEKASLFLSKVMVLDYSVSEWAIAYALKDIYCPGYGVGEFLQEQDYIIQATDEVE